MLILGLCCAAVSACTLTPKYKPDASVTHPAVGHPAPPSSAQQANASEAFTPYADVGSDPADALAPSMTQEDLLKACMNNLGFAGTSGAYGDVLQSQDTQPYGSWGYLGGAAEAEQDAFAPVLFVAGSSLFVDGNAARPSAAGEHAMNKCLSITGKFFATQMSGPLSLITTLGNDIQADMQHDPAVKSATRAWSACMAQNGYHMTNPASVVGLKAFAGQRIAAIGAGQAVTSASDALYQYKSDFNPSPSQRRALVAMAVADADCTQSTDLGGIWFAVQASYAQQIVNQNQQALNSAVTEYRTAYQKALAALPR
jgi:hypothetical protein